MALQRSGRAIVYPNQIAYETDILRTNMYRMTDIAMLAQSILGNGVNNSQLVGGLSCTQDSPPSTTQVLVGQGALYQLEDYDATAYSTIPAETTIQLYKQFVRLGVQSVPGFAIPVSGTNYYLIQAEGSTTDENAVNRPYYDSDNPSVPQFVTEDDTRVDSVALTLKLSTVSTPTPDAGKVGLYAVTIPSGSASIINSMISVYPGAPFINISLFSAVTYDQLQKSSPIYSLATGTANAIVASPSPTYTSLVTGTHIYVKIASNNTGATSLNVSGLGATSVRYPSGAVLVGGELITGMIAEFFYDGTNFQLMNPLVLSALIPTGTMLDFGAASVPTGYLGCDGTAVSRTTYANLFSVIGVTWGIGDGSTTFNLPDFRRKTAIGSGGSGTGVIGNTTGDTGGSETHTLDLTELTPHTHTPSNPSHTFIIGNAGGPSSLDSPGNVQADSTTGSTGGGDPFNIMQPSNVVTKIIKI